MKKSKGIFMLWAFALILLLAFLPSASDPIHAGTTARQFTGAQAWDEYEGTIPMNLVTVVGETGNEYSTALSQIAAIPLNIRSDGYLTAAGLLLPDSITHPQESPLEEWLALADNSIDELVFIGNVSNHTYLSSLADEFTEISGANHYEVASEIALEYFQGTQAVVVAYAGSLDDIFNVQTLVDASGEHLGPPQVDTISASTTPSRDWEWMGSVAPSGGGIICEFSSDGGNYMSIDLLAQRGTEYYSLDYGYTSEMRVRYPYENSPHEDWKLHVIDWYDESRTVDFDFEVKSIAADTYTVNVNPGEDCRIDIDVDFGASQVRGGLHILGPTGELILNANRYSMLTEVPGFGEVYNIRASLSHPMPGDYEIFVTNSEDYSISYDLSIVKNTVKDEWQASAASSANAASLASILGAPILYTDSDSLTTTTLNAIAALKPEEVWIVDPLSGISSAVTAQLASLAEEVNELKSFREVHNELTGRAMLPRTGGRVTLYDSQGTHFVPAALSATKRHDVALPFHYGDSGVMTLAQVPEQIAYNRDYTVAFGAEPAFLDVWTNDLSLSMYNPPYESIVPIADAFYPWLAQQAGIDSPTSIVTIAPYQGIGETLPAVFERAISGRTLAGRYPSVDPDSTSAQIMRSILRIPLQSAENRSNTALGTYLVYNHGAEITLSDLSPQYPSNAMNFDDMVAIAGLSPALQVGPSVTNLLEASPYYWSFSTHGITGMNLYEDDGEVANMDYDFIRAFDEGESELSPDDGDGVVNPPQYYWSATTMSNLIRNADVNGMIAVLDACQIASSYSPAVLMEAGAGAVVAAWTDVLVGQSDYLEYGLLRDMIYYNSNLGEAMNRALEETSHVYSQHTESRDYVLTSSDFYLIGASLQQFMVFGDPEVTIYDWDTNPFPMMERSGLVPFKPALKSQPGTTFELPVGYWDPVGHVYPMEGSFVVSVEYPDESILVSEEINTETDGRAILEFEFPEDAPLGTYTATIESISEAWSVEFSIILEWAEFDLISVDATSIGQLELWSFDMAVFNSLDSYALGVVTIYLDDVPIHVQDVNWAAQGSSQIISYQALYPAAGDHDITVTLHNPRSSLSAETWSTAASFGVHWTFFGVFGGIPILGAAALITSLIVKKRTNSIKGLKEAYQWEQGGTFDEAMEAYMKQDMLRASTRVAAKLDFSETALMKLNQKFGMRVHPMIRERAADLERIGNLRNAARAYRVLGNAPRALVCEAKSDIQDGAVSEAVAGFNELVNLRESAQTMELVGFIASRIPDELAMNFVAQAQSSIRLLSTMVKGQPIDKSSLIALVSRGDDEATELAVKIELGYISDIAAMIQGKEDLDEKIRLTNLIPHTQKAAAAEIVTRGLKDSSASEDIAEYLLKIELGPREVARLASPLIEALLDKPNDKKIGKALRSLSEAFTPEGIHEINQALETAEKLLQIAKEKGATPKDLDTFTILSIIPSIPSNEGIRPLLEAAEMKYWKGTPPESVHIDTLAEFTQKLREVIYNHGLDETHILADRLKNLEGTLLNRLKRQAIDQISRLSMRGVSDEEDKISAQEISGLVAKEICVLNPSAAVRALQQLMEQRNLVELRGFAERGVMKADPQQVLQKTLTTAEISRLISRHRVVRRRPDGTYVMEPDLVGATQEIMNRLVEQWARKAYDIWKNGLFQAMRTIILEALPKQLPERQKVLIAAYGISTVYKHAVSNALGKAGAFAGEIMSGGGLTRDCVVEAVKHASLPEDAQNRILNSLDTGGVEL